jgi:hypothetical protein
MFSKLSNFSGPLSSFYNTIGTRLLLSLDSNYYNLYKKSFSFDQIDSSGVTFSSNSVTSQTGGGWNDKGISVERIPLGSPFKLKFKRGEALGDIMCGVSQTPPIDNQATYTRSSFGFYLGAGTGGASRISLTESGYFSINETNGSYPASTVYSIIFDGIRVKYYIDDNLFYTSGSVPTNDLFLYILFLQNDKSITDIEFGGTNPIWNDTSGNGNNFNLINKPKYLNGSFNFNDGLTQSAHGDDLGTLKQFTIDTWFKLNSLPSVGENPQIIINTFDGGHPYINFAIGFLNGPPIGNSWDGKISGGFFTGFPNYWKYTDGFTPEIETWYNVTLTYDEVDLKLYLDGTLYSSTSCTVSVTSSGLGIDIGKRWDVPDLTDREIDVVNIWDGPLSSTQILNKYNNISPRYVFATASIVLDGSSSIEIPAGNKFALGTTYTIEFWSKAATSSAPNHIYTVMAQRDGDSNIDIFYQNGYLVIRNGTVVTAEPPPGVWTHVAIVSDNTTLSVYYNGASQSVSGSGGNLSNNTYGLSIGCRGPLNNFQFFNGSLYGIRINNTVVYTENFIPGYIAPGYITPGYIIEDDLYSTSVDNISGTILLIKEYNVSSGKFLDSSHNMSIINNGATHSSDLPNKSYRYYKWYIDGVYGGPGNMVQVGEFAFYNNGITQSYVGLTLTNPPYNGNLPNEGVNNLIDGNLQLKWLNMQIINDSHTSVYFDFSAPLLFNSYRWLTANDSDIYPERNPVSWSIFGSNDNSNWTLLHSVSSFVVDSTPLTWQQMQYFS